MEISDTLTTMDVSFRDVIRLLSIFMYDRNCDQKKQITFYIEKIAPAHTCISINEHNAEFPYIRCNNCLQTCFNH